jgi:uncharacterized protein YbaA (DUF1428 family)
MKPTYIDAFVLVIPKDKVERYKKMATDGCNVWMKFGALSYRECIGHDISAVAEEGMESLPFGKLVNLKEDETVWFSYIEYASKEHRDEVNAKVMAHWNEKFTDNPEAMSEYSDVLDMKRLSTGGFSIEVSND